MIQASIRYLAVFVLVLTPLNIVPSPSFGEGVSQGNNIEKTRVLAAAGHAEAQYLLGEMLTNGRGVPEDRHEAARWLRKSAAKGYAPAQYMLGYLWAYGGGGILPNDKPADIKPRFWFRKAAQQGHAGAQRELGKEYLYLPPENPFAAADWLRKAAERGDGEAQMLLGALYVVGQGVTVNLIHAYKWASLAQKHLTTDAALRKQAADLLRNASTQLTPEQLQAAKSLVRQWKPAR